jgi:hypothetical protein
MKRMTVGRSLVLAQLWVLGFAIAHTAIHSPAQTDARIAINEGGPQIAVSASALDFGGVGVKRTKELTLTVSNVGGAVLKGTARMAGPKAPFSIKDAAYSLKSGERKQLRVRYTPSEPGTNTDSIILSGAGVVQVPVRGWAGIPPQPPGNVRFVTPEDVDRADLIVRYNSDSTSFVVRPAQKETIGEHVFYSILQRAEVLKLAAEQPRRELAIVVLPHFSLRTSDSTAMSRSSEDARPEWQWNLGTLVSELGKAGYQRFIFCEGGRKVDQVAGLRILEGPQGAGAASGLRRAVVGPGLWRLHRAPATQAGG